MKILKRILILISPVAFFYLIVFGIGMKASATKTQVQDFCARYKVGDSVTDVASKMKEFGFKHVIDGKPKKTGEPHRFIGSMTGFATLRFFCIIDHQDNKIINVEVNSLD